MPTLVKRTRIDVPARAVFDWHAGPGAFERLAPPWDKLRIVERTGGIQDGGRLVFEIRNGPVPIRWVARHRDFRDGEQFVDEQLRGPFAAWVHTHRFLPDGPRASFLEDEIEYRLPGGPVVAALAGRKIDRRLRRLLRFRHRRTCSDLLRQAPFAERGARRIVVSGAAGLIGSALCPFLTTAGHCVDTLVRRTPVPGSTEIEWNPDAGRLDPRALEGADAVVHLAGQNIAARWTDAYKARIRDSRVRGTQLLAQTLAALERKPSVLICASAIGFYGDRGDEVLTEDSPAGGGFLPEVCREWEDAAEPARAAGIRVVHLRIGVVLARQGGALASMIRPFRLGLGGRVGTGRQYLSWIALDDLVGLIHYALFCDELRGPVNAVAPEPLMNAEFTKVLGRVVRRPTILPLPALAVKLLLGEMGKDLLLASTRVRPVRAEAGGFEFLYPSLEYALRCELGLE